MERFKIGCMSPSGMNKNSPYGGLKINALSGFGKMPTNIPISGIPAVEAPQNPITKQFFLEDQLPHDCDSVTIIKAARALYPDGMILQNPQLVLPYAGEPVAQKQISRWYVVDGNRVISAKTRKIAGFSGLEQFLRNVERGIKDTVIVSFGREDFRKVSEIVESKTGTGWGTAVQISDVYEYRAHTYGRNVERVPPKYRGLGLK